MLPTLHSWVGLLHLRAISFSTRTSQSSIHHSKHHWVPASNDDNHYYPSLPSLIELRTLPPLRRYFLSTYIQQHCHLPISYFLSDAKLSRTILGMCLLSPIFVDSNTKHRSHPVDIIKDYVLSLLVMYVRRDEPEPDPSSRSACNETTRL
jgi:hypothetical protein